jgi:quaternary ammonium compound-resistance protein SugE
MTPQLAWTILVVAGLLEVGWAIGLKYTEGFTRLVPSALTLTAMVASIVLLGLALKALPVGTAYAVWTGIGAAGTVIFGMLFLNESVSPHKIIAVALILAGVIGLNLSGSTH